MTIDEQIKEKTVTLAKINAEIDEFNAYKVGLAREISIELLAAKEKADKIISEAEAKAATTNELLMNTKLVAEQYVSKIRKEADDLLKSNQARAIKLTEDETKIKRAKEEFDNLKYSHEADMRDKSARLNKAEKDLNERQGCLDTQEITLRTKENQYIKKAEILEQDKVAHAAKQLRLETDQATLKTNREAYLIDKATIEAQAASNSQIQDKIAEDQAKVEADRQTNEVALADIASREAKIAEAKIAINTQFDLIEQSNANLEERKIALDEREQLLNLKDQEVISKIAILNELRLKGQ